MVIGASSALFALGAYAQDPPSRVARLNFVMGNVSMQPAGADEWAPAVINRPLTTGDNLWADTDARVELHLNNAAIRLGPQTAFGILNLDDHTAQFRFSQGEMVLRIRRMRDADVVEVDTPNAAVTILRDGVYRFTADPDSAATSVAVRRGDVEVTSGGQAFGVHPGSIAQISGTDQVTYDVQYAPAPDGFESWAQERDGREDRVMSARYLPPDVIGYEDMDAYGSWTNAAGTGAVWYPSVGADWAPYHDGHWAWIEPWGWSWVDDAPWGFAPFHYGRWSFIGGRWGWLPGPMAIVAGGPGYVQPIYAPALVAFIGGGGFGVSLSIGGPAVGWVPLGPGEVYTPAYHMSAAYFRSVNVSNTTVVNNVNITNVYNNVYVNKTVTNVNNQHFANMAAPHAVTAMPQTAFASGRPVKQAGVSIGANQIAQVRSAPVAIAPPVAPTRQALAPMATARRVVQPPARVAQTQVVAKVAPPPPPVSFAAKQSVLQQNAGRPLNVQAVRQAVPAQQRPMAAPAVRVAAPAKQVTVAPSSTPHPVTPQQVPQNRPPAQQPQTPQYRPPTQPQQQTTPIRPPAQPQTPTTPQYRPPTQPQTQTTPQYRPPTQPQTQTTPQYRPPTQPQTQTTPQYRPPTQPQQITPQYRPPTQPQQQATPIRPPAPPQQTTPQYRPPAQPQQQPTPQYRPPAQPQQQPAPQYRPPVQQQAPPKQAPKPPQKPAPKEKPNKE